MLEGNREGAKSGRAIPAGIQIAFRFCCAAGVNPSHLPNELLARCEELWETRQKDSDAFDRETHATVRALKGDIETSASDVVEKGLLGRSFIGCKHLGATTCVMTFIFGEQLRIINIGDSMILHLRRSELRRSSGEGKKRTLTSQTEDETLPSTGISSSRVDTTAAPYPYFVLTSSTPQHHFFNCPYQLTRMYDVLMDDESLFQSVLSSADCFTSPARPGDIVILGSDGLFDNVKDGPTNHFTGLISWLYNVRLLQLFLSDILDIVSRHCHDRSSHGIPRCPPKVVATALLHVSKTAHVASLHALLYFMSLAFLLRLLSMRLGPLPAMAPVRGRPARTRLPVTGPSSAAT